MPRYARVAPPLPVEGLFSYLVPEALLDRVVPGVRVTVPFGRQKLQAMCVAVDDAPPPEGITPKPISALLEDEPLIDEEVLQLAGWVAKHTGCTWGEALDAALPRAVKIGNPGRRVRHARLAIDAHAVPGVVKQLLEKHEKQARALRILADRGGDLPVRELMSLAHVSDSPLKSLVKLGFLEFASVRVEHDPMLRMPVARTEPLQLTPDQASVTGAMIDAFEAGGSETFVLQGVTGSGKTEVYLQLLRHVIDAGRQGIVLVPEIALTPQTVKRFRERFEQVAVLHSHLTDAERADQWRRIRRGEAQVVVGARSAVFAPVPRLGCIVVDEEHETTFKQQNVPRYHAREVAVERARLAAARVDGADGRGAVVVLGTATPSLEATHRARTGLYTRLLLPERVAGGVLPDVHVVDLTVEERRKGYTFLSDPLRAAIEDALGRGGQVILFLNRRGWASVLMCPTCRGSLKCPSCEVSMTLHQRAVRVICHYCGHEEPPPERCATCDKPFTALSFGTEKVEDEVRRSFPRALVARMDSDTMSGRGAHASVLDRFAERKVDLLIGTQMIAKGLDFPNTLLVGVICADSALFLPDYRAAERTYQLLAQVVGRTGRGPKGGRVVVQAYDPRHYSVTCGMRQDQEAFAARELAEREAAGYPPFGRLVRVIAQAPEAPDAVKRLTELTDLLRGDAAEGALVGGAGPIDGVTVLGPAPAPIPRINKQYRFHAVCKCHDDAGVEHVLARLAGKTGPARRARVLLDVDPVTML